MAAGKLISFLCIAFVVQFVVVSGTPSATNTGFRLDVNPPNMHEGFTKHLGINCSFDNHQGSDIGTLLTIIVTKEIAGVFTDVASIASYGSSQIDVKNNLGADVRGRLSASGVSFISYEWIDPTSDVQGRYRCESLGMDHLGHPKTISDTANIEEKMVDLSMALDKINELKVQVYQHQLRENTSSSLTENCVQVKANMTIVTDELNQCKNLTSKAADCELDKVNMSVQMQQCNNDKHNLTSEISNMKVKENNLSTSLTTCTSDKAMMSSTIDQCNQDLKDKNLTISQRINETAKLNANLNECLLGKMNLTMTLSQCENKETVLISDRDQCEQDKKNINDLLNECRAFSQTLNATVNNHGDSLAKCESALMSAHMSSFNCSKDLYTLQQLYANATTHVPNCKLETDLLKSAYMEATFEKISGVHNGHVYYLSHPVSTNITHSHNICQSLGGTLAEIDNRNEYTFVKEFCLNSNVHSPTFAMLGATDLNYVAWAYYSSGHVAGYTDWAWGEPNGGKYENCMYLYWQVESNMHDGHCYSLDQQTRFVCELPQTI